MSVITDKWFEYKPPAWMSDPEVNAEFKRIAVEEMGLGEEYAMCEAMDMDSRCFECGEILQFPYVYWHGSDVAGNGKGKGISLHAHCAQQMCIGISRDAEEILSKNNQ